MGRISFLLNKEFKQFFRSPFMVGLAFITPIIIMLIMPVCAVMDVKHVNLAVVDFDRTPLSVNLVKAIEASDFFTVESAPNSYEGALEEVQKGNVDIILQIPEGVENEVMAGRNTEVLIAANALNNTKGIIGSGHLNTLISNFSRGMNDSGEISAPLEVSVRNLYNNHLDYSLYMAPACLILILLAICSFLPTLNIVSEKEKGTIEQINVTPVTKLEFIASKLIFYGVLGLAMFTLSFLLGMVIYGIAPYGGIGVIFLAAILFIFFLSGFGLTIANVSETLQQSVLLTFFFLMIFVMLCGLFTPVKSMVPWAYGMTYALPPRYFIDIIRSVCLKGSSIIDLRLEFLMLAASAIAMDAVAVLTYRKKS